MRRRRQRAGREVTCWCSKYEFPHRLGSGNCRGREWAEAYFEKDHSCCRLCNLNAGGHCEVAVGQESIRYCDAMAEYLRYPGDRLPPDERVDDFDEEREAHEQLAADRSYQTAA